MDLDQQDLDLLARFLVKRFPHPADRAPILKRAALTDCDGSPTEAWHAILVQAQASEALEDLGRALQSDDPDDANLREVRRILMGEPTSTRWPWLVAGGAALSMAAGAALVAGLFLAGDPELAPPAVLASAEQPAPSFVAVQDMALATVQEIEPPAREPVPEPEVAPPAAEPDPATVPAKPAVQKAGLSKRKVTEDHCVKKGAEVRGYWYAGSEIIGELGQTIVVPHDVNVRAEYPNFRNEYDTRAPVQCVLYEGDVIKLSTAPIPVPIDTYWIEITGADVVRAGG
jgi:hypothetical protein